MNGSLDTISIQFGIAWINVTKGLSFWSGRIVSLLGSFNEITLLEIHATVILVLVGCKLKQITFAANYISCYQRYWC